MIEMHIKSIFLTTSLILIYSATLVLNIRKYLQSPYIAISVWLFVRPVNPPKAIVLTGISKILFCKIVYPFDALRYQTICLVHFVI